MERLWKMASAAEDKSSETHQRDVCWRWRSPAVARPRPVQRRRSRPLRGKCSWHASQSLILPRMWWSGRAAGGWSAGPVRTARTGPCRWRRRFRRSAGRRCCTWCPSCLPSREEAATEGWEPCRWSTRPGSWEPTGVLKKRDVKLRECNDSFMCYWNATIHAAEPQSKRSLQVENSNTQVSVFVS